MGPLNDIKLKLRSYRKSKNPLVRFCIETLAAIYNSRLLVVDCCHRSVVLLKLFSRNVVHQTTPLTWMDRYPNIFSTVEAYFAGNSDLNILSFGCSTGEEVLTLRAYFPTA